jgi:orotate phosphoribosyltransferase
MNAVEQQLLELIRERAFRTGGPFPLASGGTSDYYIDLRLISVHGQGATLIGQTLRQHLRDLDFDAIGGMEVGAIPLTTAAVIALHDHLRVINGFWVRKQAKDHGTGKLIEGNLKPGARVVILEDVMTRGESAMRVVRAVQDHGCTVLMVLALMDRLAGAGKLFADNNIPFRSVFTVRDLGVNP